MLLYIWLGKMNTRQRIEFVHLSSFPPIHDSFLLPFFFFFFPYFKDRWGSTLSRVAHFGSSHLPTGVLQQLSRADETITKIVMVRFGGLSFGDYHA